MHLLALCVKPQEAITKLCANLHHSLVALKRYFPASLVAPLPNSEQINHPSPNHIYTTSTPNHIHHHYALSITLTHTTHIISSTAPILSPLDLWTALLECTACQMAGEAGWWTTSGNIGLPPLARVMGVGRQQQQLIEVLSILCYIYYSTIIIDLYTIYITFIFVCHVSIIIIHLIVRSRGTTQYWHFKALRYNLSKCIHYKENEEDNYFI